MKSINEISTLCVHPRTLCAVYSTFPHLRLANRLSIATLYLEIIEFGCFDVPKRRTSRTTTTRRVSALRGNIRANVCYLVEENEASLRRIV